MKITVLDCCTVTNGDVYLDPIKALGEVYLYDVIEPEKLAETIGDSDAVICNKAKITKEIMDECKNLKYVGLFATGYNNIDTVAAKERGIVVCNVPGYSTDSVAQLVFSMILHFATSSDIYNESVR
ncbi:MAG: D-2-hydroxyacid dehydrogenase, partial [Clostridiales bacterium]|nr:D-2-hydroxyacid dehydrogenase [Clostridiales bacterium]